MSTVPVGGRVPIRLDPIPGESFDSWLDAYAQRLLMSGRELGQALGVPPKLLRLRGANVARGHQELDAGQIAARACGLDPAQVRALWCGLARYDRLVAKQAAAAGARRHAVQWFARVLRLMVSSRYCASCLRASGGRWLAAWRLPWYVACPTHQTMLASDCAACGGTQRYAGLRAQHLPNLLTACSRPTAGRAGWFDHRCRHDLTAATPGTPAPDGLIALQAEMLAILDPDVSNRDAVELIDRLIDVLILATRIGLDLRAIDRDRRNMQSILAGPLAEAHRALSDPHGPRMRAIATADLTPQRSALPCSWDGISPKLAAVILEHRDSRLRPSERLRYRTMTAAPRRPEGTDPSTRLRALPLALWPDWSIRLRPPTIDPNTFRNGAAIALCVPGATCSIPSIRERWPGPPFVRRIVMFGRLVTADPHGTAILAALCTLADHLDRHGAAIDYEHRRALAAHVELLAPNEWTIMCRAGGTPAGGKTKLAHAWLWLWETLTGGLPKQAPSALRPPGYREFIDRHPSFALCLPAPTVRRLTEHARQLLDTHGCSHEPLAWSPGVEGIALDQLPGPNPDTIDPNLVQAELAKPQTPSQAAEQLGITLEHLRYLARKDPPDAQDPSASTAPPRVRLAAALSPEQLRRLISQGNSLRQIEASYGISRKTIRYELVAHGVPVPPGPRHQHATRRAA